MTLKIDVCYKVVHYICRTSPILIKVAKQIYTSSFTFWSKLFSLGGSTQENVNSGNQTANQIAMVKFIIKKLISSGLRIYQFFRLTYMVFRIWIVIMQSYR